MSTLATPAILRRYLVAKGWHYAPDGFMTKRDWPVRVTSSMTLGDLDNESEKVAAHELTTRSEIGARLGLLASVDVLSGAGFDGAFYSKLLALAYVEPDAWESTL